jgi:hypothetical protein
VDLNCRLRLAYVSSIGELSGQERGRRLTDEEAREALNDYPGDLPTK